jgi:pyruvate/2-oxoacid:ferredoxin oxidoreductase beta subunit
MNEHEKLALDTYMKIYKIEVEKLSKEKQHILYQYKIRELRCIEKIVQFDTKYAQLIENKEKVFLPYNEDYEQ